MQVAPTLAPQENYTILRIKRKRNEEPLDALVIESRTRRKKSKGVPGDGLGVNVFQFAETVEQAAWDDEKQKQDLEARLSTLAREKARKDVPAVTQPDEPSAPTTVAQPTSQAKPTPSAQSPVQAPRAQRQPSPKPHPRIEDPARKFTVVPSQSPALRQAESMEWEKRRRGRLAAPPKVHSYKDLQRATFTMYDAVPSSSSLASLASPNPATGASPGKMDPEVEKFLPLLQDYLKISGDASPAAALTPAPSMNSLGSQEDEDYVWDIFYSRPASVGELYGAGGVKAIGTVTGLPDDDGYGSSDESDVEDEDDEDSNAEDWYKNDYPEEEDERSDWGDEEDRSDEFHEHSDADDVVHGGVGGARGRWTLEDDD